MSTPSTDGQGNRVDQIECPSCCSKMTGIMPVLPCGHCICRKCAFSIESKTVQKCPLHDCRSNKTSFTERIQVDLLPTRHCGANIDNSSTSPPPYPDQPSTSSVTYCELHPTEPLKHHCNQCSQATCLLWKNISVALYVVRVKTSDIIMAGTDANVFVVLFGEYGVSDQFQLSDSKTHLNKFERNNVDEFHLPFMPSLGNLYKLRITHDNKWPSASWHLESVEVEEKGNPEKKWKFFCNQWLSTTKGDKTTSRDLLCGTIGPENLNPRSSFLAHSNVKYRVDVYTAKERNAGTDANVFITIYGENGDSSRQKLSSSSTHFNKFEKGSLDTFQLQMLDIDPLEKVMIEHDNSGLGPGWKLDRIEVTNLRSGEATVFPCGRWLDVTEDDGKISRELFGTKIPRRDSRSSQH